MKKFVFIFLIVILSSCTINFPIDRNDFTDDEFNTLVEETEDSAMEWIMERQSKIVRGDVGERNCVEIEQGICDFEKQDNLVLSLTKVLAIFPVYTSEESSKIDYFYVIVSDDDETQGMFITYTDHVRSYSWTYENVHDYYYNEKTNAELNRVVAGDYVQGSHYWSLNVTVNGSIQNIKEYNIAEFNNGIFV